MHHVRLVLASLFALLLMALLVSPASAYVQVGVEVEQLPHDTPWKATLREHIGSFTAEQLVIEVQPFDVPQPEVEAEQFRLWLLRQSPVGRLHVARLPAELFTLEAIESQKGLAMPTLPQDCHTYAWLAKWDNPGNPYHDNIAVQRRAFVLAAIDMIMLEELYNTDPRGAARADFLGGNLIWLGYTFSVIKDDLPTDVRNAFEQGLRTLIDRITTWGPKGLMTDMDLFAPVGLWYIQDAIGDPALTEKVTDYVRPLFTDPHYFHPAGYFVDVGCFDTSYNGISLYFGTWAALVSDWAFAKDAVAKALTLRAYLCFPEVGRGYTGPSAMSSRTSAPPPRDQWQKFQRMHAQPMVSDDAAWNTWLPGTEERQTVAASLNDRLNSQLQRKLPDVSPGKLDVWRESHWSSQINYAYELCPPDYYAHRKAMMEAGDPKQTNVFKRDASFTRTFEKAFVITKRDGYAAAIHTGPVGRPAGHRGRPYGFGGGQLSTFWTPETGAVLNGRRRGVQGRTWDDMDMWRIWPIHAVTGLTASGDVVSSSRIRQPQASFNLDSDTSTQPDTVTATGPLQAFEDLTHQLYDVHQQYSRTFNLEGKSVTIETTVTPLPKPADATAANPTAADGAADNEADDAKPEPRDTTLGEIYETLPIFIREHAGYDATTVAYQIAGQWQDADESPVANVTAVRLTRYGHAVDITFDSPRRMQLSELWTDGYQTKAECRTLRIELPADADGKRSIRYRIAPVGKQDGE